MHIYNIYGKYISKQEDNFVKMWYLSETPRTTSILLSHHKQTLDCSMFSTSQSNISQLNIVYIVRNTLDCIPWFRFSWRFCSYVIFTRLFSVLIYICRNNCFPLTIDWCVHDDVLTIMTKWYKQSLKVVTIPHPNGLSLTL